MIPFLINKKEKTRKAQVTIFIIIAILLVAGVAAFFIFRGRINIDNIPASVKPAYTTFLSCLEDDILAGTNILESQAGYIYLPAFEPGSRYMPFSSQLSFMGNPIPYWYYVSGNNLQREQVPSKSEMENQLVRYIEEKAKNCNFNSYSDQGFKITMGEPKADVKINDNNVDLSLDMLMTISKEEDNAVIKTHNIKVTTALGKLYGSAKKVYDYEQDELFLENYAIDTLRTYAPVDGVEISCGPKIWNANEVVDTLQEAIESNTLALKTEAATKEINKYFTLNLPVQESVRFVNSRNWEYSFNVEPSDGNLLIANPVGNQPGLGILGFCYVPYHFVYDINYPVLVQISDGDALYPEGHEEGTGETFQFPMAVVIQGNNPRESLAGSQVDAELTQLCNYKNNKINVRVVDENLKPVDSEISFECFGTKCNIGETSQGSLSADFPQCVNGYILARAEGYEDEKYLYSDITPGEATIVMRKVHDINVNLRVDGLSYTGDAMISFTSEKGTKNVVYPEQRSVSLSEAQYEVFVYIFKEQSLSLESGIKEQCVEVPRKGLIGIFGFTQKKCFDVEVPSQIITEVLAGGGKQQQYILESDLTRNSIEINTKSLPTPTTIEQLQTNYILFDERGLDITFN